MFAHVLTVVGFHFSYWFLFSSGVFFSFFFDLVVISSSQIGDWENTPKWNVFLKLSANVSLDNTTTEQ